MKVVPRLVNVALVTPTPVCWMKSILVRFCAVHVQPLPVAAGRLRTPVLPAVPVPTVTENEHVPLASEIEPALNPELIVGEVLLHSNVGAYMLVKIAFSVLYPAMVVLGAALITSPLLWSLIKFELTLPCSRLWMVA